MLITKSHSVIGVKSLSALKNPGWKIFLLPSKKKSDKSGIKITVSSLQLGLDYMHVTQRFLETEYGLKHFSYLDHTFPA